MNPLGSVTVPVPSGKSTPNSGVFLSNVASNGPPTFLLPNPRIPKSSPVAKNLPPFTAAPRPAIPPVSSAPLRASSVDAPPILFPTKLPRPEAKANGIVGSK